MASVVDVGAPGQTLDNPPLSEWQGAVRDVVNSSDVTVDERDASVLAAAELYTDELITISDQPPSGVPSRDGLVWIVVF